VVAIALRRSRATYLQSRCHPCALKRAARHPDFSPIRAESGWRIRHLERSGTQAALSSPQLRMNSAVVFLASAGRLGQARVMGKLTLTVAMGACMLACGAEPDDAVDEGNSSDNPPPSALPSSSASSKAATDGENADDDECSQQDGNPSTPAAALANYERLRTSAECTTQVTRPASP
jgi:hypothetical protein